MELIDARDIHVAKVLPATIDTPLFYHAANYTDRAPRGMKPFYPAELVAATIVRLAEKPMREAYVGNSGRMLAKLHVIATGLTERLMARMVERKHLQDHLAPPTAGNVLQPMAEWTGISGNWRDEPPATGHGKTGMLLLTLAALPAASLVWRKLAAPEPRRRRLPFWS